MELENIPFTITSNHFKHVFLFVDDNLKTTCESAKQPTKFKLEFQTNGMVSIFILETEDKKSRRYMSMSNINESKRRPEGFGNLTFVERESRDALMCERFFLIALGENRYALESGYQPRVYLRIEGNRGPVNEGKVNFQYCREGIDLYEQLIINCVEE